jgi:hypothetical protein
MLGAMRVMPKFSSGPPVAGYAAWYDASDTSSIAESGGAVSQWNDKSGNGYDLLQSTAGNKPTTGTVTQNGLNVLSFDGGDYLEPASYARDERATIFAVANATNNASSKMLVSYTNASYALFANASESYQGYLRNNFTNLPASATGLTGWKVITCRLHTSDRRIRVNGVESTGTNTVPNVSAARLRVGGDTTGGFYWLGSIAELFIFTDIAAPLSESEISAMESYASAKWGITF